MRNLEEVKRKVESLTTSSLENLLGRIRNLASRPIAEFSRFEAMELLEAIKNAAHDSKNEKANYYRLTCETLRSKPHSCSDAQFREYLLPLLGDKDQEKILDIMAKVEKSNRNRQERGFSRPRSEADPAPYRSIRCHYCQRFGHTRSTCYKRKRDLGVMPQGRANGATSDGKKQ